jgi:hypothetical protein
MQIVNEISRPDHNIYEATEIRFHLHNKISSKIGTHTFYCSNHAKFGAFTAVKFQTEVFCVLADVTTQKTSPWSNHAHHSRGS